MVYAARFLTSQLRPTESYVAAAIRHGVDYAAAGKIAGAVAYGTQLDAAPTPASENIAMYGNGRLSLATPHHAVVPAGAYAQARQTIVVDPNAPRYELSFWRYHASPPATPNPATTR